VHGRAGHFDIDERLKDLSAKGDERLNAIVELNCSGLIWSRRFKKEGDRSPARIWSPGYLRESLLVQVRSAILFKKVPRALNLRPQL
jgi:hypothetical protein